MGSLSIGPFFLMVVGEACFPVVLVHGRLKNISPVVMSMIRWLLIF